MRLQAAQQHSLDVSRTAARQKTPTGAPPRPVPPNSTATPEGGGLRLGFAYGRRRTKCLESPYIATTVAAARELPAGPP